MFKATGQVVSDKAGVRLQFSQDIAHLWNWYLLKATGMIFHTPLRSAKVGLYRANSYHKVSPHPEAVQWAQGRKYDVSFDVTKIQYLYSKKGYWVHFIQVDDPVVWKLLKDLGLDKNFDHGYNKPHMSISNGKYFNQK